MRNPRILVLDQGSDLATQVVDAAGRLRPRPDVMMCERTADLEDVLATEGPFDVLLAGPTMGTRLGISRLRVIRDEVPGMSLVLVFSKRPDGSLRDVVQIGAMDMLQLPVDESALHDVLDRALTLSFSQPAHASSAATDTPVTTKATVFTVSSATGGCGKTFYATNLAYFLRQHTGKRVCIVDLDLQFGEVSTGLRLRPRYTISDVLTLEEEGDTDLEAHFPEYVVAHDSGVHVLAAPKDPADADRIQPTDVTRVIQAAASQYDYVVVDTPSALTEVVLAAFDQSDGLYVLATLDLPSVRNMGVFLNTLEKLKIPTETIKLILNKAERDVGISVDQVRKLFLKDFASVLPYAREVSKSVNFGTPILALAPNCEVSRRMSDGMVPLLPERHLAEAGTEEVTHRRGFLSRMFHLSVQPSG
ncbi:MAG: AAA family ATPase [Actinobacteria bacterium]|nr:AAA family ATPase [Actinomycetota bacterium]